MAEVQMRQEMLSVVQEREDVCKEADVLFRARRRV